MIGIFGDNHFHDYARFSNGDSSRLARCVENFEMICKEMHEAGCSEIILTGDLLDLPQHINSKTLASMIPMLKRLNQKYGLAFYIVDGNHETYGYEDYNGIERYKPKSILETFATLFDFFHVIDFKRITLKCGTTVYGIPFLRTSEHYDIALTDMYKEGAPDILITHCNLEGAGLDFHQPDIMLADLAELKWVFNGHIHPPHRIASNRVNVGSPMQKSVAEENKRSCYYLLDTKTNKLTTVDITDKSPAFKTVDEPTSDGFNYYIVKPVIKKQVQLDYAFEASATNKDLLEAYIRQLALDDEVLIAAGKECLNSI
jgi:DNA repair exonuclease SbcCD nuclease subunit